MFEEIIVVPGNPKESYTCITSDSRPYPWHGWERAAIHCYQMKQFDYFAQTEAAYTCRLVAEACREILDHGGYVLIRDMNHPRSDNRGYVKEHIKVWMEVHKREVPKGWQVHHINGNKKDNRPENLVALSDKKHRRVIPLLQRRIRFLEQRLFKLEGNVISRRNK